MDCRIALNKRVGGRGTDSLIIFLQKADQMIRLIHYKLLLEIKSSAKTLPMIALILISSEMAKAAISMSLASVGVSYAQ